MRFRIALCALLFGMASGARADGEPDRHESGPRAATVRRADVEGRGGAEKSPGKILGEPGNRLAGLQPFQAAKLANELNFTSAQIKAASKLFDG